MTQTKTRKRLLTALGVLIALVVLAAAGIFCLWGDEIRSLASIRQIAVSNDDHNDG